MDKLLYSYTSAWNSKSLEYSQNFPNSIIFHPTTKRIMQNGVIYGNGEGGPIYINGSGSSTGTWKGSSNLITEYYNGLSIIYVNDAAGSTTTTLNINNLGAKTCYYNGSSKLTTHYTTGTPIMFTYYNNGWRRADYTVDNTNTFETKTYHSETNNTYYIGFYNREGNIDKQYTYTNGNIIYNPGTTTLEAPTIKASNFIGNLTGNADTSSYATTGDLSHRSELAVIKTITSGITYLLGSKSKTNNTYAYTYVDNELYYDTSTNTLVTSIFQGSLNGNAATATNATNANTATNSLYFKTTDTTTNNSYNIIFTDKLGNNATAYINSNIKYNPSTATLETVNMNLTSLTSRYIDGGINSVNTDHVLHIGYGNKTFSEITKFYYSTGTTDTTSSRTQFAEINSDGLYALTRFGVAGQNTDYILYVNGTSMFKDIVNIDSNGMGAKTHINFNRVGYNYINIPTSGKLTISVNGAQSANGKLQVTANAVTPGETTNKSIDLGTSTYQWKNIWGLNFRTTNYEITESSSSTGNRLSFGTEGQTTAKGINIGNLLVSNSWSDYSLIPTNGIYSKGVIRSGVATGTAPLTIASTTKVSNLNADLLDGEHNYSIKAFPGNTSSVLFSTLPYLENGISLFSSTPIVSMTEAPYGKCYGPISSYKTYTSDYIAVQPGDKLYGEIWAYRAANATGTAGVLYYGICRFDRNKKPIASNNGITYFVASNVTITADGLWYKYTGTHTLPTSHTVYDGSDGGGVYYIQIVILVNYRSGTIPTYIGGFNLKRIQSELYSNYEHTHEFNDISNKLIGSSSNEFDFADNYNTTNIWINWKLSKNNTTNTTYNYSQAKNSNDVRVGIDQYIFGRACGSELEHNYSYIYANGYRSAIHNSDSYVLLAGGGVKAVSDFSATDNKVAQNKSTSSENLRVLFKYSANDTNETNYSKYSSTLYYNPSTKLLTNSGGLTINGGVVNITGITSYAEGIRLHNVSGLSSIWFGAVNSTGYDNGMWGISVDTNGMRFRGPESSSGTSPNDYINILHGGNVGIGTTSPSYKLDVAGTGQFTSTSNTVLRLISSNTDSSILYSQSSGISWTVGSTSSNKFYFANNYVNSNSYSIVSYINNLGSGNFRGIGMDNYIAYPKDAMYLTIASSITGAIQISLPTAVWKSNTMMKMTVEIFNYSTGTSSTYIISGYNYTSPSWANVTAYSLRNGLQDKGNLKVRFGWNSATTRNIIWIGEPTTVWSYPKVYVKDICLGQSNDSFDKWISGWNISFVQNFEVVYTTISNPAINYNSNLLDSHQRIGNLDIANNNYLVKQAFFDVSANSQSPEIDKYYRIATFIAGTAGYDRDALLYTVDIINKKYWLYRVVHRRNTSTDKNYQIYVISTNSSPDYLRIYYGEYNQSAEIFITQKTSGTGTKTILTKVFIEGLRASLEGNYIQLDSTVVETPTYTNYNSGQYAINISWSNITDKTTSKTVWGQNYINSNGEFQNVTGDMTSVGNITPSANASKNLGSSSNRWLNIYGRNLQSDTTLYLDSTASTSIIFRIGGVEKARFCQPNGYLGIGVTSPSYPVHASGIVYASTYLYGGSGVYIKGSGNVISSNANNKDLWFGCNGLYINFDAENKTFRRGTAGADANTTLGTSTYPWKTTYSGGLHHSDHDNDDSVLLAGGGHKLLSSLSEDVANADIVTFTKSLTVTSNWMDTGITINDTNFPKGDGTYIIQINASAVNNSTNKYDRYYSGIMSVYTGTTNDTNSDEIILHNASHASIKRLYLRTIQQSSNSNYKLQISSDVNYSTAYSLIFKFRKMI